jgi:quinol monooxygenase YgiN
VAVAARIYLVGYLDVPAERCDAVLAALPYHIALTEVESGCISFSVTPDADIEGRLLVSEVFVDQAAFDVHQARA